MGGHVLWLPGQYIQVIEKISAKKKATYDELEGFFEPVMTQAALREQYVIIRMMYKKNWSSSEIAEFFGYPVCLVEELLSLDEKEEYDYAWINGMKTVTHRD